MYNPLYFASLRVLVLAAPAISSVDSGMIADDFSSYPLVLGTGNTSSIKPNKMELEVSSQYLQVSDSFLEQPQ